MKVVPGTNSGQVAPWKDEPWSLTEPIVSERVLERQQEQIRQDTVVSQEKGGGV